MQCMASTYTIAKAVGVGFGTSDTQCLLWVITAGSDPVS